MPQPWRCFLSSRKMTSHAWRQTSNIPVNPTFVQISKILPLLGNLSQINLQYILLEKSLLTILNRHPGVTVFLESVVGLLTLLREPCSLVERINSLDLSKTVLLNISVHGQMDEVKTCLAHGLQIWSLHLSNLDESLAGCRIHGLRKIALTSRNFTEPWFRKFVQEHPLLKTINLDNNFNNHFYLRNGPIIPLLLHTFIQQIREAKVDRVVSFRVTLTRANLGAIPNFKRQWCITELSLILYKWSSGRVLQLAQSSFPQISTLTIELRGWDGKVPFVCHPHIWSPPISTESLLGRTRHLTEFLRLTTIIELD